MNKLFSFILVVLLTACGGSSSSGGDVDVTAPGSNIPAAFVGVYRGTLNVTAEALGVSESDSFPITITVQSDGTIIFEGDDPDERFTAGVTNEGEFSGNLDIDEDECKGRVAVQGRVDGTTATGTVDGDGECEVASATIDVSLKGDFQATK